MKDLMVAGSKDKKMSSVEISGLMNKEHKNVIRDIKKLIEQQAINALNFELVNYRDAKGEYRPMYLLDFQATMVLITGYDSKRRSAVINRWMELEQGLVAAPKLPTNYKEALTHLLAKVEENEQLQITIAEQAPKVEFAEAVQASTKSIKIGDFVKIISNKTGFVIGRNNFFKWLRWEQIIDRRSMPYQKYIDCGWFEVKESTYEHTTTNGQQVCFTTLITGQGQVSILSRFKKSDAFKKYLNKDAKFAAQSLLPDARA